MDAKKSADAEVESLSKSLVKNREHLSIAKQRVVVAQEATAAAKKELDMALNANDIAATEVAQTKVAIAAKREDTAINEVNTISRKINNQEKRIGTARTQADTAATIINNATTAGNTAAANLMCSCSWFFSCSKVEAAIATRTLTAAMATNPIGAILTVVSLADFCVDCYLGIIQKRLRQSYRSFVKSKIDLKNQPTTFSIHCMIQMKQK